MGCLLGCFGRRKNRRRQRRRESFQPRLNRISEGSTKDVQLNLKVPFVKEVPKSVNADHLKLSVPSIEEVPNSVNGDHLNLRVSSVEEVPKSVNGDHLNLRVPSIVEVPKSVNGDHLNLKVSSVEEVPKTYVVPLTKICDKAEEKKSTSPSPSRKRVTFDSNVKKYEPIEVEESIGLFEEKKEEVKSLKSSQAQCSSEGSDVTINSSGSYPSNYRYQNCRESDDEEEDVTDCDDSGLEDDDDDEDGLLDEDYYNEHNYEDKLNKWDKQVYTEEIADNVMDIERIEEKTNVSARDRSGYVNAVLNPIENLTQWKAVKSKGRTTQTQSRKENMTKASFSLEEPRADKISSSSSSSSSSLFSLNLKSRDETKKQRTQEIAVDASLSTWLSTSTTSSVSMGVETATSEKKKEYSKAVQSHDERPILGALTAEDIKQFSAMNSPRKSPSRSPESPIIGTVGRYWNNHSMVTSKYGDVLRSINSSDKFVESVREIDEAISEMKFNPLFPKGLQNLSSNTLSKAKEFFLEHLMNNSTLKDKQLQAILVAAVESDDGITDIIDWKLCERQSVVSCVSALETGLKTLTKNIEPKESLQREDNDTTLLSSVERPIELLTWNNWQSKGLCYFLSKRTLRLVSGVSLIFSAPKAQWAEVLKRLRDSAENDDDMFIQKIMDSFDRIIMSVSYKSVTVSEQYEELHKLIVQSSKSLKENEIALDSKVEEILEYLTEILETRIHNLWKLPSALTAAAIPAWSPLFGQYLGEIEKHLKRDLSRTRYKDLNEHKDCELAERVWCLYVFHKTN